MAREVERLLQLSHATPLGAHHSLASINSGKPSASNLRPWVSLLPLARKLSLSLSLSSMFDDGLP